MGGLVPHPLQLSAASIYVTLVLSTGLENCQIYQQTMQKYGDAKEEEPCIY